MSDPKSSSGKGSTKGVKRNLPPWISGRDNGGESHNIKQTSSAEKGDNDKGEKSRQAKGIGKGHVNIESSKDSKNNESCSASASSTTNFSKLLEGVVFVLSGFVNPERSILRSQALEMGAEYQADWNADCTLLICAFPNTPKFRQVEADCGTIVSKEWILECYRKKKLVDIESYLLHVGKPWRRSNSSFAASQVAGQNVSPSPKPQKFVEKSSHSESNNRALSKGKASNPISECLSHSDVKKWAIDDLHSTILWLESQEEKPEPDEIKEIAAEGILTCLQDAIDSLKQKQDIHQMTDQWKFVPRVVKELAKLKGTKEDLCKQAMMCKDIYESELRNGPRKSPESKKNLKKRTREEKQCESEAGGHGYESDETIEMTEEEIDIAFKALTSKS